MSDVFQLDNRNIKEIGKSGHILSANQKRLRPLPNPTRAEVIPPRVAVISASNQKPVNLLLAN